MPTDRDYARCKECGGAQGYGSAAQGGGLCNCVKAAASRPTPEPAVLPWMVAAATEYVGTRPEDVRAGYARLLAHIIAKHAPPAPAVRDAAVEELVQTLEAYMALDHDDCTGTEYEGLCKACTTRKRAVAAIARVKGTKEESHA